MKIIVSTFGSRGDLHPMLALGRMLQARGHTPVLLSSPAFAPDAARAGLGFIPAGDAGDLARTQAHARLWHPVDGLGVMWRYLLRPALKPVFEALVHEHQATRSQGEKLLVIASPMAMGARLAQEKTGLALVSSYTAATLLRSVANPLTIAQWRVPPACPGWMRWAVWNALDRYKLDPLARPALNALRVEIGLPTLERQIFACWMHSPLAGLTLFPEWFAETAPDWPPQVRRAGFALFDEQQQALDSGLTSTANADTCLPPELAQFLAAGAPPVVFMPGSARLHARPFFQAAIAACARTGLRGILLGHWDGLPTTTSAFAGPPVSEPLPDFIWAARYQAFAPLLPHASAIVHHGGIGSCAEALRAGVPQLAWPQAYDQFDNALRLQRLGCGFALPAGGTPSATVLADSLEKLLGDAAVKKSSAAQALKMAASGAVWHDILPWLEAQAA